MWLSIAEAQQVIHSSLFFPFKITLRSVGSIKIYFRIKFNGTHFKEFHRTIKVHSIYFFFKLSHLFARRLREQYFFF